MLETTQHARRLGSGVAAGLIVLCSATKAESAAPRLAFTSAHQTPFDEPPEGWETLATATVLLAPIYDTLERPRYVVGSVQRGSVVAATPAKSAEPCHDRGEAGRWYRIPGGFVCSASGFDIADAPAELQPPQRLPDLSKAVPFPFVKVTQTDSVRYEAPRTSRELVEEYQTKAYFLAVGGKIERGDTRWVRTVYNEFVQADETRPIQPTELVGERLSPGHSLPMGFVYGAPEGLDVRCAEAATKPCEHVDNYHRFANPTLTKSGSLRYLGADGQPRFIGAEHVRVIRRVARPRGVSKTARWVHVDLQNQAFVAYEGDEPVYTSLVSTGIPSHATPNGLHRVYRKYVTKTMRGPDPDAGRYRVEEIPWVMYYRGNYALHGAYWHDSFGNVRSHGCTNIAPKDAKWLYHWGSGEMPPGWHANYKVDEGTWVYLTGSLRS